MDEYYKDKIAIVTGANSGIGYAVSEELLKRGAVVYMAGRSPEKIAKAAEQLSAYGDRVRTLVMDVTKEDEVRKGIEGTAAEAGGLDFLFNNAGVGSAMPFEQVTLEDWRRIIDTNLWSVIYGVHFAVPIMLGQGSGHIVNTSSVAGLFPPPFQALYSLTKFGVTGMTECLRYEFAEKGLYFSTICPANIATSIFIKSLDGTAHGDLRVPDDAYPVEKAAEEILDGVAAQKGIIVVPEEPSTELWRGYVRGDPEAERCLVRMERDRRESFETKGTYF